MRVLKDATGAGKASKSTASKKATNLSVDAQLLDRARALNINLSATLDEALRRKIADADGDQWRRDNKAAIAAYNDAVEAHGLFGDDEREF